MTITQELRLFIGHNLSDMQDLKQQGRISDRLYGHYCFLWLWGAYRDDYRHDLFYKRMGRDAYWRRIERVKALIERIRAVPIPAPEHIPFAVGTLNR